MTHGPEDAAKRSANATPFERVIAQRPDPAELERFRRELDNPLECTWSEAATNRYDINEGDVEIDLGPELTRNDELVRYLASSHSRYEGTFAVILDVRRGPAHDGDDGICELGPIVSYSMEWYEPGADFVALREAGVRLSWEAAQWLYAVGCEELAELHATGRVHAATTPRQIRLALFHRPYTPSRKRPDARLGTHGASVYGAEVEHPAVFAFVGGTRECNDTGRIADRATLARTVAGLTTHPDPEIDRLLHDTEVAAADVLRDLLLQRGRPIEPLLRDRANVTGLADAPLVDGTSIDDEFDALWNKVLELDPMIDSSDPAIYELPPPYVESIHGEANELAAELR